MLISRLGSWVFRKQFMKYGRLLVSSNGKLQGRCFVSKCQNPVMSLNKFRVLTAWFDNLKRHQIPAVGSSFNVVESLKIKVI